MINDFLFDVTLFVFLLLPVLNTHKKKFFFYLPAVKEDVEISLLEN